MDKKNDTVKDNLVKTVEYLKYKGPIFIRIPSPPEVENQNGNLIAEAPLLS